MQINFLGKNKLIQISGLVLAIVTCIFIGQFAFYEYSFDSFNKDHDRIYRTQGTEGMLLSQLAKEQLGFIENSARVHPCYRGVTVVSGENSFYEGNAYFADGALFDILTLPTVKGNAKEALTHINQVVISEKYATKYFGKEDPIGKTLQVNGSYENNITYTVAAVFRNIPQNSHFQADILFSIENILANKMYTVDGPWRWRNFFTYFKTKIPVSEEQVEKSFISLELKNGMPEREEAEASCPVFLLGDIHLNGQTNYMDNNRNRSDINIRIFIAFIILAIAWLNFINIDLGNALKNKVSFSVKKVLGASSLNVWKEVLQKTVFLILGAFLIAAVLFFVLNPILKKTGTLPSIELPGYWQFILWISMFGIQIIGVFLISTVMYGLINKQHWANILSNRSKSAKQNHSPWITLFVLQFGASIVLICFALGATKQVNGLINADKGIETSHVLAIRSPYFSVGGNIGSDRKVFEQEALKIPGIAGVTSASYIPGSTISSQMPTRLVGKDEDSNINSRMNFVGYDYLSLFGHKLLAGRNFSKEFPTDASGIIINERLAKAYGFDNPTDAIGKEIYWESKNVTRHIIGVMEDFHHQSADMPVEPAMFQFWELANGYCLLKINAANPLETINSLEKLWKQIHRSNAFEMLWVDEHYQKQFYRWVQLVQMVKALSFIAIFIACIGLFGLSSMLLEKRTKEIGIRKVNGAKVSEILSFLNKDFIKWVIIAFIIATPLAYYAMHKWLENFAYKTELSWWIFALAGLLALGIALLTVSWQSWRAATKNPVEALRYE